MYPGESSSKGAARVMAFTVMRALLGGKVRGPVMTLAGPGGDVGCMKYVLDAPVGFRIYVDQDPACIRQSKRRDGDARHVNAKISGAKLPPLSVANCDFCGCFGNGIWPELRSVTFAERGVLAVWYQRAREMTDGVAWRVAQALAGPSSSDPDEVRLRGVSEIISKLTGTEYYASIDYLSRHKANTPMRVSLFTRNLVGADVDLLPRGTVHKIDDGTADALWRKYRRAFGFNLACEIMNTSGAPDKLRALEVLDAA